MAVFTATSNANQTMDISVTGGVGSVTLHAYRFDGTSTFRSPSFTLTGSGGILDAVVSWDVGYYVLIASDDSGVIGQIFARQRDEESQGAVYFQVLNDIADGIDALQLTGLGPCKRMWIPQHLKTDADNTLPKIIVAPAGQESDISDLIGKDKIQYPVIVVTVHESNQASRKHMSQVLQWRQDIARRFRNQPLIYVPHARQVEIVYDVVCDSNAFMKGLIVSALMFNVQVSEPRGI